MNHAVTPEAAAVVTTIDVNQSTSHFGIMAS
jgi:hypothetical protein